MANLFKIELRCRAMMRCLGLLDHYFIVVDGMEYHYGGRYNDGVVLPAGTTVGSHLVTTKTICRLCYDKFMLDCHLARDTRQFHGLYPFINCETIVMGISIQSMFIFVIPFIFILFSNKLYTLALILFIITFCLLLAVSKYRYSKTDRSMCEHLETPTVTT
jgi:hypothetical protein